MQNGCAVYSQYKKLYAVDTHERSGVFDARRHYVFAYLADEINHAVWIQLQIDEAGKSLDATASGNSIDDAEVADTFENKRYWKFRYEVMEDEQLLVEPPVFAYSFEEARLFV